jgi:metal-responsive CopG/Arc/MetJ family transcriptional regulator
MSTTKIVVSIDEKTIKKIDLYVTKHVFKSRSHAFQISINQTLEHLEHSLLAKECEKLDVAFEQEMADFGIGCSY